MAATGATSVRLADGVQLHVLTWLDGDQTGTPVLLVHGLASNAHLWDGVGDELARRGHPVAAVDQRGHGLSDKTDHGYDVATLASDLVAVSNALEFDRPVAVGQSWGGNVVVELAALHPTSVRGVAGVDGGTIELSAIFPTWDACAAALRPPQLIGTPAAQIEATLRSMHADWPESGIAGAMANFEVRADGTVAPWLTFDRHLEILRDLYRHRPSERWANIDVPVMLIPADNPDSSHESSKREQVRMAEKLLARPRVHWLTGDHDLHAQQPAVVAELLSSAVGDGFFA